MLQNNHKLYILFTLLLILTIYKEHFALKEILFSLLKSCQKWINHSGVWMNKIIQKPQKYCDTLQKRTMVTIEDPTLNEASGLIASRKQKGILYSHNDSSSNATIHILDSNGKNIGRIELEDTLSFDTEDIAIGPSSIHDRDYIYLGDIGNNWHAKIHPFIYKFLEPKIDIDKNKPLTFRIPSEEIVKIQLEYPDSPQDFETLLLDPLSNDIYLIQKNWFSRSASLHKFVQPLTTGKRTHRLTLRHIGQTEGWMITSGDVSSDGSKVLLRNYQGSWLFNRKNNESLDELLQQEPDCTVFQEIEKQGESISFSHDNHGFYTTSEGQNPPLYYYEFR